MNTMPLRSRLSTFLSELKRRRVFRLAAVYGGVAFAILAVVSAGANIAKREPAMTYHRCPNDEARGQQPRDQFPISKSAWKRFQKSTPSSFGEPLHCLALKTGPRPFRFRELAAYG